MKEDLLDKFILDCTFCATNKKNYQEHLAIKTRPMIKLPS